MRNLKKILFTNLLVLVLILMLLVPAMAVDGSTPEVPTEYITWEFLGTMAGATTAVLLIIQFIKAPLDKVWKIPTRVVAWIFALIVLVSVEIVTTGQFSLDRILLALLNSIIVTMAAMGAYEISFSKLENKDTPG